MKREDSYHNVVVEDALILDLREQEKSKHKDKELEEAKLKRPSDCMDLDKSTSKSGIYKIYPENTSGFNVFCEIEEHGGGWTVIQRRINGDINFFRDWESFKRGFGNMNGEHWLGNEHLNQLTSQGTYMSDFENIKRHAVYNTFSVGSETSGYKLDVTGYSGDAGDAMESHNGQTFSTMDKDNDVYKDNCAEQFKGGWWYDKCYFSNLNGFYLKGSHSTYGDGVNWYQWKGNNYSLKTTTMMIRRT
ncbi:Angiopoietin-related protein 1,Ficolin-1-A,Angiopoietin-1,Fibrinogen C domain-containing protein 1,Ryncolin-1,Tenascin-N,Angiopoietin-related protein 7,Angiopoietin-related protein 6,Fibrinogen C domain-containing protein 1-B,Fibrinogen-like protein 1,Ficolin-1,Ficolin-1-B,Angiopoietin-4,Fibrinogen-like protein 1-like protein,Ryncolin-2,Techylectin-5B,Tenascin-R,Fibrinogen C domain-containing protein 1-A,Microfibril-associated glycoprotein 4,Fibrinogen-like protein A,Ryncolin-3,Angiopoietin-2,Tenascin-X,Fi|uniref:Fibrinogen C-terminal domain-containing protein n=1 Tax=Mytilus edulis TaxID=6550 RepID=A0A8S3TQP8_MYTED|nr:Angiopoietin-related protein 1,Ficolin-1-A,Angiopoietin-1,Fibrinogen C domain-containing protein 1,Ryncolin-1,Tenascin-N,Angiopoietin-related protein 7,Angiopoietin-related protein 6,Fibrinogen C domain-containing protein 1-B,Fibrinogen-like protein 1,Ficolin-1,Ficolin-1-B,Angiopoietin-4,Fibrinogen-like protein 1-like protein,Ryncolin-2,Techylectin-5B,Tenascin-R,Fibrinogen C domain-containing protein 1-A,Microfibril-associated glycoprotein 4,Fibrinogen-like protein A,Ryncolin-3,Angiopoietin-2,Te